MTQTWVLAHIRADGITNLSRKTRPGEYMDVFENERGTFIFNSKDLCTIRHIPELVQSGIASLKIEGRVKNFLLCCNGCRGVQT